MYLLGIQAPVFNLRPRVYAPTGFTVNLGRRAFLARTRGLGSWERISGQHCHFGVLVFANHSDGGGK